MDECCNSDLKTPEQAFLILSRETAAEYLSQLVHRCSLMIAWTQGHKQL